MLKKAFYFSSAAKISGSFSVKYFSSIGFEGLKPKSLNFAIWLKSPPLPFKDVKALSKPLLKVSKLVESPSS